MWASIRAAFGGPTGPYGEDPWSRLRKDRSMRSRQQDEDRLQGTSNRAFLRQTCMDLYRTSGLAKAAVNRIADYSTTCAPYPVTPDGEYNKESAEFFSDWTRIADYRQRPGVTLCSFVHMIHIADHLHGELFFILLANGQLQPIEADRIGTPREYRDDPAVTDGIRTNAHGIITHYYVLDRDKYGAPDPAHFKRIAANDMIHVADPWRVDMLHGIPRLHGAVQKLEDYAETDDAMRAKVKNEAQRFFQTDQSLPLGGGRVRSAGPDGAKYKVLQTEIGTVFDGPGSLDILEGKSPGTTYTPHMVEECKAVAAACDIPYEYLMMVFTAGSYNAQKGARLAFRDTCTRRAAFVSRLFLQRAWEWRIAKAINAGEIRPAPIVRNARGVPRSTWNRVEWGKPVFQDIDLGRDVSAKSAAWAAGQQSLRDQHDHPYQVLADKVADIKEADRLAQELNKSLGTGKITWQHIINAGVPGLTIPPAEGDENDPTPPQGEQDE